MSLVNATARRAMRRRRLDRFQRKLGIALTAGSALAVLMVLVDRLFALELNPSVLIGAPVGVAIVAAGAWTMRKGDSLLAAASAVDQALGLKDRLSSAIALDRSGGFSPDVAVAPPSGTRLSPGGTGVSSVMRTGERNPDVHTHAGRDRHGAESRATRDPFAALAIADAERIAGGVHLAEATPILFGSAWWWWPIALSLATIGAIFLPAFDLADRRERAAQIARITSQQVAAENDIVVARESLAPHDVPLEDFATPTDLEILEQIETQLASGAISPDEARASAAGVLHNVADELEQRADRAAIRLDSLRDELSHLDPGWNGSSSGADPLREEETSPVSPLRKALSAGDFAAAERLLSDYQRTLDQLSESDRESLASELNRLAAAMPGREPLRDESIAHSPDSDDPGRQVSVSGADDAAPVRHVDGTVPGGPVGSPVPPSSSERDLDRMGLDEPTRERLRQATDREAIREALHDAGLDEQTAEELADRVSRDNLEHMERANARDDAARLQEALRRAADEVGKEQPPPSPHQPPNRSSEGASPPSNDMNPTGAPSTTGDAANSNQSKDRIPSPLPDHPGKDAQPSPPGQSPSPDRTAPVRKQLPTETPSETPTASPAPASPSTPSAPKSPSPPTPAGAESEDSRSGSGAPGESGPSSQSAPAPNAPQGSERQGKETSSPGGGTVPGETGVSPVMPSPSDEPPPPGADSPQPGSDESPPGSEPRPSGSGAPGEHGLDRARELLREFQDRQRRANDNRRLSDDTRRRAQEMLERMSPEQREQLDRWARGLAREDQDGTGGTIPGGAGVPPVNPERRASSETHQTFTTTPLDLRPRGDVAADRVIAQWFNPDAAPGDAGDVSRRAFEEQIERAAESAERAIEEQTVPRRYDRIIKRFFDSGNRRAPVPAQPGEAGHPSGATPAPPTPAPPAVPSPSNN